MHYSPHLPVAKERHNQEYAPEPPNIRCSNNGQSRMLGMLVTGTYVINNIQGNHLRAGIFIVHQPQTVVKYLFVYLHKIE